MFGNTPDDDHRLAADPGARLSRLFTVFVTLLLLTSVVAPAAMAQPAAAQEDDGGYIDGSFEGTCDSKLRFAFPISCPNAAFAEPSIDEEQTASAVEVDIHTGATGTGESYDQIDTVYQNYLQDTETLASLEAKNAIADAYENNSSVSVAENKADQAITDYYSVHENQIIQKIRADLYEVHYYKSVAEDNPEIDNDFVHMSPPEPGGTASDHQLANAVNGTTTLLNGSDVSSPQIDLGTVNFGGSTSGANLNLVNGWDASNDWFEYNKPIDDDPGYWNGLIVVYNQPDAGLDTAVVYDFREAMYRLDEIESQHSTAKANYDTAIVQDLYDAMDSGELDPNDVRGSEGMVRYMSGDSESTEDRFNLALRSTLDLAAADLDSTMTVDFEGATERTRNANESTGNVSYSYNSVNETYKGLLFSSETPEGGFEKGVTYNVSNFNGTTTMVYNGGSKEATFYQGNFTITAMTDGDGNSVDSVDWQDPKYDSYNASEYVAALEKANEQRSMILAEDSNDGDPSFGWPGGLTGPSAAVALLITAVALAFIGGKTS